MDRDLFILARQSHAQAKLIADLLLNPITAEATALSAQGFVVPSPETLANAAKVFVSVHAMPGENAAMGGDAHTPQQRLDLVCALATSLQGLDDAIDLTWSSAWAAAGRISETPPRLQALQVLGEWNAGNGQRLLAEMTAAFKAHEQDEIWRR